jgi:hypothetical protein
MSIVTKSNINWIPKRMMLESTTDIGSMSRGKYTLPKIAALVTKVEEVDVRQAEK